MIVIREYTAPDKNNWDKYVNEHPHSTLYHLSGWKNVIEKTYGHKTYYLIARKSGKSINSINSINAINETWASQHQAGNIAGVVPLVHLKHFLFGNSLISIPFLDMGGILANDEEIKIAMINAAIKLAQKLGAKSIEIRQINPINSLESQIQNSEFKIKNFNIATHSHKVRMLIDLPNSSETLMKSFKSKLRSQIKKPLKEGLKAKIGGLELINDFYHVFTVNMRDLGSPVHPKTLFRNVLEEFEGNIKIIIIYKEHEPTACSLIVGFNDTLENPWASALRQYSRMSPNMLLYWTMLEYACDNGYKYFDFGRSTPDGGTYKFKEQWGAKPEPLHWHYISLNGNPIDVGTSEKSKFDKAIQYWQKLPVPVTKIIGPLIRKHIGL